MVRADDPIVGEYFGKPKKGVVRVIDLRFLVLVSEDTVGTG